MVDRLLDWLNLGGNRQERRPKGCRACGQCCQLFGGHLHASASDLKRWREMGRDDLVQRVNRLGWIWVDPQTKARIEICPFLQPTGPQSSGCAIHDLKPDICKAYPTLAHGRRCVRGIQFGTFPLPALTVPLLELLGDITIASQPFLFGALAGIP